MTGGFQTVAFCEKDNFCQRILQKHWPDVSIFDDVREVDYDGEIDLICGGFPCQPFSVAGQRRGTDDDRHLWPEMLALVEQHQPTWFIGENVAGLKNMAFPDSKAVLEGRTITRDTHYDHYESIYTRQETMLLNSFCKDLESIGYEVIPLIIPACSINAPHRRDRCWILAHTNSFKRRQLRYGQFEIAGTSEAVADTGSLRMQESRQSERPLYSKKSQGGKADNAVDGCGRIAEPGMGGGFDGLSGWLDRSFGEGWESGIPRTTPGGELRTKRIAALGNAVVPQIVAIIGQAILEVEG